jgi:hypothetical protein
MGGIKADIPREQLVGVAAEAINCIKEIFAVMPPCAVKFIRRGSSALNRAFLEQSI